MSEAGSWRFRRIGIIVTGKGEQSFLPSLFRHLMADGDCTFEIIKRVGQQSPRTAAPPVRRLVMGTGKPVSGKDVSQYGLAARGYLRNKGDYVLLIDDLEWDRKGQAAAVVERYRRALDTVLDDEQQARAAVYLLVMMLEAYYLADPDAVNAVLGPVLTAPEDDVEAVRHPKNDLKALHPGFDEIEHGQQIIARLDVPRILARPDHCRALRTLMTWCAVALGKPEPAGELYEPTRGQIGALRAALA